VAPDLQERIASAASRRDGGQQASIVQRHGRDRPVRRGRCEGRGPVRGDLGGEARAVADPREDGSVQPRFRAPGAGVLLSHGSVGRLVECVLQSRFWLLERHPRHHVRRQRRGGGSLRRERVGEDGPEAAHSAQRDRESGARASPARPVAHDDVEDPVAAPRVGFQ